MHIRVEENDKHFVLGELEKGDSEDHLNNH